MKKRVIALILCATMFLSMNIPSFATEDAQLESAVNEETLLSVEEESESVSIDESEVCEECQKTPCECDLVDILFESEPQVGDIVWIKTGSKVWKDYGNVYKGTHELLGNYEVKITEIIYGADNAPAWYKFEFINLGMGEWLLHTGGYKYVEIENTTVEEPDEIIPEESESAEECTCGTEEGFHAEDCPLYEEPEDDGFNDVYIEYEGVASNGVAVNVSGIDSAFPEQTMMSVTTTSVDENTVSNLIANYDFEMEILGMSAVDISFGGIQPSESVVLKLTLPESEIPEGTNKIIIVHFGANGVEVVGESYLITDDGDQVVSVSVDGFSSYAAVYVNGKYNSQKMSSVLSEDTRYSVVDFNVDLFNYDPLTINNALNEVTTDENGFHFTGYGIAGMGSNDGINNATADYAKQGILESELENGLPVINYLTGENSGVNTGKVLFSDTDYTSAKTIYNDIPFEFVYDNQTGYYQYKSSANHAQLNEDGTKIELYADTLSTNNSYAGTLDLTTHYDANDVQGINVNTSSYKATAKNGTTGEGDRLDPYVVFSVNNISAASVGQIYVKAKIPSSIGSNSFQLFFDTKESGGMAEEKSFVIPYTATGDWIEFVVDVSECANWTGTITNIRIDLFDEKMKSNGSTLSRQGEYAFEIAQISLINKNIDDYVTRGGFYPFSEIQDSYPGNNTAFTLSAWENLMKESGIATARASRSIFNPAPSPSTDLYDELAYGIVMEFDFYLPVDRSGEQLTYYFNGDDDLWVFVDNKLALDVGGGHGAITGTLNFTTGDISVANAITVSGYNTNKNDVGEKSGKISDDMMTAGRHTMKIFYLERGGSVSNCYMKFNLPQTPQGSVSVTKTVEEVNDADLSTLQEEEFTFYIKTKNLGAGSEHNESPLAEQEFYILSNGKSKDAITGTNGEFTLKHGEEAVFDIDENYEVKLIEEKKEIPGYEREKTTVNGEEKFELCQTTVQNQEINFDYKNIYDEKEVVFTYIPVNPKECPDEVKGTVELTGSPEGATYEEIGVSETIGVSVGVPVGSTATETDAVKFVGWYSDEDCTNLISGDEVFMPSREEGELWETSTYYAKFEYKYGNLQISKTGILEVDHHDAQEESSTNNVNKKERQSTMYKITGTSYSGISIDMDVVIVGNDNVTIQHLPVGKYTITEDQNWSWRYTETLSDGMKEVIVEDGKNVQVSFTNRRDEIYWLSGDCYAGNWWGNEEGHVERRNNPISN